MLKKGILKSQQAEWELCLNPIDLALERLANSPVTGASLWWGFSATNPFLELGTSASSALASDKPGNKTLQ